MVEGEVVRGWIGLVMDGVDGVLEDLEEGEGRRELCCHNFLLFLFLFLFFFFFLFSVMNLF